MMLVEETTIPSTALPVEPFKDHLRLGTGFADDGVQDTVLESFLRAALAALEARTGKILLTREFSWGLTDWRDRCSQPLPVAPITGLVSLTMLDRAGNASPLAISDFALEQDHHRPRLAATTGLLPAITPRGSINIRFTAGFAASFDALPADLSQAVLMLASHYYDNRNALGIPDTSLPFGVAVLVERYKTVRILGGGVQ